ncbi:hypothetical protein, partial [Escherichia coli]|uniref:hypothetical protein n=1 Tax=Escherichia coli TaxID=562 RepID=UPI000BE53B64
PRLPSSPASPARPTPSPCGVRAQQTKYILDFKNINFILLLFKVLLFWFMGFFFSRTQLLSLNRTSILFLPPDGTLKIK